MLSAVCLPPLFSMSLFRSMASRVPSPGNRALCTRCGQLGRGLDAVLAVWKTLDAAAVAPDPTWDLLAWPGLLGATSVAPSPLDPAPPPAVGAVYTCNNRRAGPHCHRH